VSKSAFAFSSTVTGVATVPLAAGTGAGGGSVAAAGVGGTSVAVVGGTSAAVGVVVDAAACASLGCAARVPMGLLGSPAMERAAAPARERLELLSFVEFLFPLCGNTCFHLFCICYRICCLLVLAMCGPVFERTL
jgi:hypothetical protein